MRRTWIKLYVELLDDPKLALLPDGVRLRFVQLLLVAAELDEDGLLPDIKRLAWRLRIDHPQLLVELRNLKQAGLLCQEDNRWKVTNFKKRQFSESLERVKRYRERNSNAERNGAVAAEESPSPSSSPSQGEEVQEEGGASTRLSSAGSTVAPRASRPRHKPGSSAAARTEFEFNAGTRQAERLLLRVASLAALPPGELPRVEQVAALAARYGPEAAGRELTAQHERWLKTVSEKTRKPYSPLNFGWVDWADAALGGLSPPGTETQAGDPPIYDGSDYDAMVANAAPPPPYYAETLARLAASRQGKGAGK